MATDLVKIIDPDNAVGTDYTDADAWEDAFGGVADSGDCVGQDQVAIGKCRCTGGTIDSSVVLIDGWTAVDSTRYIQLWTDPDDTGGDGQGGSYRHLNLWPGATDKIYRRDKIIAIWHPYTRITGLAIAPTTSNGIGIVQTNNISVSYCFIKAGTWSISVECNSGAGTSGPHYFWNNTISGSLQVGFYIWGTAGVGSGVHIYSCTMAKEGAVCNGFQRASSSGNTYVFNTLVYGYTNCFSGVYAGGDYNAASTDDGPGAHSIALSAVAVEALFTNYAGGNYSIIMGSVCTLTGANLYADPTIPITDDILGTPRANGPQSIGSYEEPIPPPPIAQKPVVKLFGNGIVLSNLVDSATFFKFTMN